MGSKTGLDAVEKNIPAWYRTSAVRAWSQVFTTQTLHQLPSPTGFRDKMHGTHVSTSFIRKCAYLYSYRHQPSHAYVWLLKIQNISSQKELSDLGLQVNLIDLRLRNVREPKWLGVSLRLGKRRIHTEFSWLNPFGNIHSEDRKG
jgi:hypothetical protein